MYTNEDFARARAMKRYETDQYWELRKQGVSLHPWDFGCVDWTHNIDGKLDLWVPVNPDAPPIPEERRTKSIPLEQQKYTGALSDDSRWENLQAGWSKRIDMGLVSDYWRDYKNWN